MQQDTNENNETTEHETESYDKKSVRKDIINLKNDMQEYEQEIPYQPGEKETNGTRQYTKGNNQKEIDSNQKKKLKKYCQMI